MSSSTYYYFVSIILVSLIANGLCVDYTIFKFCNQSSFCTRSRAQQPSLASKFQIRTKPIVSTDAKTFSAEIINAENNHLFSLDLHAVNRGDTFRLRIDEKQPLKPRHRVEDALQNEPVVQAFTRTEITDTKSIVQFGVNRLEIIHSPFRIDCYRDGLLTITINGKGLMRFEHLQVKPNPAPTDGTWEEEYNGFVDSKPNGPQAIALDFTFPQAKVLFGIPEHADSFALRTTINGEPYRLYNLDTPFHETDSGMGLYGSIPVLYGHGVPRTGGIFWHNAAETWVDIYPASTNTPLQAQAAHFMTESGIIDVFLMLGHTPMPVFKQYTDLTGVVPLPQYHSLAYHQCRWNYDNQSDVMDVAALFNHYDIPLDTMWLDIEYTDGKKYFTWDPITFANPAYMIQNLTQNDKHLNVIIDIHIKRDDGYRLNRELIENDLYTKLPNGSDYIGECWPGLSSYPDIFNPKARDYLAEQYSFENFPYSTRDIMIWNDMNEPSTFNGPEKTFPKDLIHYGGWEHRDVHNQFGHMQLKSTHAGLLKRTDGKLRPFTLTRSHFAGSQRYAMIWTGDNTASWDFMRVAMKMCLTSGVVGFSFCGADVGGFFNHPNGELIRRWYQAAAFQPFYRSHANMGTPRREPWLYDDLTLDVVRQAVKKRYTYLPMWYTLFYEHEMMGYPVMRPLLAEYPADEYGFKLDNVYMLGNKLLVQPINKPGVTSFNVYFPYISNTLWDIWYDIDTLQKFDKPGTFNISVMSHSIPVYQRGGTIIPKKDTIARQTATQMRDDPYTLVICLNANEQAFGTLYIDDEESFDYRQGKYLYQRFDYANGQLSNERLDALADYNSKTQIKKIIVAGMKKTLKSIVKTVETVETELAFSEMSDYVVVDNVNINVNDMWQMDFKSSATSTVIKTSIMFIGFMLLFMYI